MSMRGSARLTGWLMGGALLGKLLGFVRELEMARLLGATMVADSFRGALSAVLLPIAPLQGDIVPSVLIPLHREWTSQGRAVPLFNSLMATFAAVALALTVIVWCFADAWVGFLLPGFSPEAHRLTASFVRVMSLAMPASVLCAGMVCIEISIGRSRVATLRASIINVALMGGIAIMAVTGQAVAIAWAFALGFNALMLYGGYQLCHEGEIAFARIGLAPALTALATFAGRMRPLIAQPFFDQGNIVLERLLASTAAVGTLASLEYARTLSESILFLVAQPVGFVVLAAGAADKLRILKVARLVLGVAVPLSLYFGLFAPDLASVVFKRGAFGDEAVALTAGALRGIAVGLWAATLGWILLRMLNAERRNAAAGWLIVASYSANMVVNLLVVPRWGAFGLGLGEGVRGLVLLGGGVVLLGWGWGFCRLAAELLALVLPLSALFYAVLVTSAAPLVRVAAAGLVTGVAIAIWSWMRLPELRELAVRAIGGRFAASDRIR